MAGGHIFISHARDDVAFVKGLIRRLRALKVATWRDVDALPPGGDWRRGIDRALRRAAALVVVLSPSSARSEYVTYEWAFALGAGVRVVPVLWKEAAVHPRLAALQHIDFTKPGKPWLRLADALGVGRSVAGVGQKPEIRAAFAVEDGEPTKVGHEYVILLSVKGAPAGATKVTYEVHDDTFPDPRWSETDAGEGFATWMQSYGDVLLSADIRAPGGKVRVEETLFRALRRTHGRSKDAAIRRALRDIEQN